MQTCSHLDPVLRARGLSKVYRMGEVDVVALRGVDLDLVEGEFLVLLGASGSGKSTLLNILGGLDGPTSGEVRYRDRDLTEADDALLTSYRREHVGFVFQFYNLIPSLSARENVALITDIADDLLRMKGQAITIAVVVACGIASYVTMQSAYASLLRARDVYYASQRFADVSVHLKRAAKTLLPRIESIPGVAVVELRRVGGS
jgi:predicted ABC-type transport system involved in lysophospholipase L1 biosynthesis ATPase subunit